MKTTNYSYERPEAVSSQNFYGLRKYTVCFDIEEVTDEPNGYRYRFNSVTLDPGVWGYGPLVSAIVKAAYPSDEMEAVTNNYLANPENPEALAEFQNMQRWRAHAKQIARGLFPDGDA